ncbi:MAG: hypothetical protein LBT09_06625 [Planctomycetaceae bacterium]|nr:hypothetical protein [Planctomycetaceae bacterium]
MLSKKMLMRKILTVAFLLLTFGLTSYVLVWGETVNFVQTLNNKQPQQRNNSVEFLFFAIIMLINSLGNFVWNFRRTSDCNDYIGKTEYKTLA